MSHDGMKEQRLGVDLGGGKTMRPVESKWDRRTLEVALKKMAGYRGAVPADLPPVYAWQQGVQDCMRLVRDMLRGRDMTTKPALDAATLAAVREEVRKLRHAGDENTADRAHNHAVADVLALLNRLEREPPTPLTPTQTAEVERIAEGVFKRQYEATKSEQPAPAPAAKRVEAFINIYADNAAPDYWRAWPTRDQAEAGRSQTRDYLRTACVTELPGVHDATSAAAFERAVMRAQKHLAVLYTDNIDEEAAACVAALAPYLSEAPQ